MFQVVLDRQVRLYPFGGSGFPGEFLLDAISKEYAIGGGEAVSDYRLQITDYRLQITDYR